MRATHNVWRVVRGNVAVLCSDRMFLPFQQATGHGPHARRSA